jgi:shikimate kinase
MQNIVLIGFMGVGKGSVAREVIKQSDYIAIDTDDIIESMENRKVKKIFEAEGEPYFRELEGKVARWLASSVHNTLVSTGGGFFKVPNLKEIGKVVLLHAEFDTIYKRIMDHPNAKQKIKKRPLFKEKKKAKQLYKEREAQYMEVADIVIDVTGKTVEAIAKEILKKV